MQVLEKRLIILLVFCLFGSSGYAQSKDVPKMSLKEAKQYALDNNVDINNAKLDQVRAEKDVKETRANLLPQIDGEVQGRRNFDIRTNVISFQFPGTPEAQKSEVKFGTDYTAEYSINASQLIFDGSFFMGLKASKTYVQLSQKQFKQTERDIKVKVAKAYHSALVTGRNLRILKKNVKEVEQNLHETSKMYENGMVEELDVDRLRLTLQNLQNQVSEVKRERDVSRKLLKFQMGYPIKDTLGLENTLDTSLPMNKRKEMIPEDFEPSDRIELKTLDVRQKLAELNRKQFNRAYLPTVNAFATHLQNAQRNEFNFFDTDQEWFPSTYAGLQVNIPIFDGLRKSAKIQKAKIDKKKLKNREENLKESIWLEVSRSKKDYNNALARAKNQKDNLELARKIYNQTQTKYQEGVGSSIEVTQARNDLFEAQTKFINAVYDYLIAEIDLKKALGAY